MNKITCIIDTSSYVNLDAFQYYRGSLLTSLESKAVFKFSSEVHYEIMNHEQKTMPPRNRRLNQVYHPQRLRVDEYQNILWGRVRNREEGSLGEVENFIVALDVFIHGSTKNHGIIIYLTDDNRALRGLLEEVSLAFPYNIIWNSYDVILYLYLVDNHFIYDLAKDAIQHIYAFTATDDNKMDPEKNKERIRIKNRYEKLLDKVKSLKSRQ